MENYQAANQHAHPGCEWARCGAFGRGQEHAQAQENDVVQHLANELPTRKLQCLSAEVLQRVFSVADDPDARRSVTQKCVDQVENLLDLLQRMRAQDTDAIQVISLLSNTVVNYINLAAGGFEGRLARSKLRYDGLLGCSAGNVGRNSC